ncbi:MAG: T9SS type A sorting domain-containing protein [Taibaiella sp.]|jgi:hypothetical protein
MKTIYFLSIAFALSLSAAAQDKIVIHYDNNGNRVLRERVCPGCRPAPDAPVPDAPLAATENRLQAIALPGTWFRVYPNPSSNNFNLVLDLASLKTNCEVVLNDQLGREIYRKKITGANTVISTKQLTDGTYYLILHRGDNKETIKLVKESGY